MAKLQHWWLRARTSFWFLPAIIVAGCVLLAFALIEVDVHFDGDWLDQLPLVFGAGAEGSRGLLGVVASSMITVAGVVFSITIVALSLTSSQYTSRVLRNFMGDSSNQFVLGAFLGIFAYCLVVLRTIRGGDEGAFVPSLSVLMGLVLGLVGIAVLIYFIHHIAVSIQAAHILANVAAETLEAVDRLFPKGVGEELEPPLQEPPLAGRVWQAVYAKQTGYIQGIDVPRLLEVARKQQAIVRMDRGIGEFVVEGTLIASVLASKAPDDEATTRIRSLYSFDRQRTLEQDATFGIRQIVDVALKALSPGINDTTTAVMCVDYLTAILARVSECRIESQFRSDDGELRVMTAGPSFASLSAEAFDQIRQNSAGNVALLNAMLWSLEVLAARNNMAARRNVLKAHAQSIEELLRRSVTATVDRELLEARSRRVIRLLGESLPV
jgi:uncharacterized membrane protein